MPVRRIIYDNQYYSDALQTSGNVMRNTGGIEWTFWNGNASIEVHQSLDYFSGLTGLDNTTQFGDLRAILKMVAHRDDEAGVVISGGFGTAFPTAPRPDGLGGFFYFSPFFGYLIDPPQSNWYILGFEQLDIPSDGRDQVLVQSSVAFGYWWRKNDPSKFITRIAPSLELHLYDPIGRAPSKELTGLMYRDVLNIASGMTFFLRDRVRLAAVLNAPISTRRDYAVEAQFHMDYRF
jgi:hypothetical protein